MFVKLVTSMIYSLFHDFICEGTVHPEGNPVQLFSYMPVTSVISWYSLGYPNGDLIQLNKQNHFDF
jgi:hypothetical protein